MNIDRLVCVGLSHQTAPVELREQFSHWPLGDLRTNVVEELVVLSTCNRLELYAYVAESAELRREGDPTQPLIDLIRAHQTVLSAEFVDHLYHFQGEAVTHHLCRVAAGLESLVMGEGQILGQVRAALQHAYAAKSVGPALSLLFRTGINAGKRARTETEISTNAVSVSSAAIGLATQMSGDLRTKQIALMGLGEMGQLALKGLRARGVSQPILTNRTFAKAEQLAAMYGGQPRPFHELSEVLAQSDIVFTATSARQPLFSVEVIKAVMDQRIHRPLMLIDLAVPRNIDAAVATIPGVQLYDVDDLRAAVDDALSARRAEVPCVEAIIDELLTEWHQQCRELRLRPVVVGLRQQAEQTRRRIVERTLRHLEQQQGAVDEATSDQLQYLSRALVNHLLHEPTIKLKQNAAEPDGAAYAALVCDLFGLDIPIPGDDEDAGDAIDVDSIDVDSISTDDIDGFALEQMSDPVASEEYRFPFVPPAAAKPYPFAPTQQSPLQYELVGQP